MRRILLAGVATIAVGGGASLAHAQSPVFDMTTRPGKLDGAAPGSVQVNIGGTLFAGILFQGGTGDTGTSHVQNPNLVDYLRLYPNFDYASPTGFHYGVSAQIRSTPNTQNEGHTTATLDWFSAVGYVSNDKFGKFEAGTPNDAIDQLGVGTGDDYGTGGFYSEYGWVNETTFIMADAYDGDNPKQKLAYISPQFAGFTFAVSYQPTAVGLNNSSGLLETPPTGSGAASKNRVEVALQFAHAFGPVAVKADVGYATASAAPVAGNTSAYDSVSYFNAGAVANFLGFEVEGSVNTGAFSAAGNDGGNWGGPKLKGAHDTTSWIAGVGYNAGPYSIGAQYYSLTFDEFDALGVGTLGKSARGDGPSLGAGYQVGPGVSVYLDAITDNNRAGGVNTHGSALGVGGYISW